MITDLIVKAFAALGKPAPENYASCIYKSGLFDSAEVMQLLLEIEIEVDVRLDLADLMKGDISVERLHDALLQL